MANLVLLRVSDMIAIDKQWSMHKDVEEDHDAMLCRVQRAAGRCEAAGATALAASESLAGNGWAVTHR